MEGPFHQLFDFRRHIALELFPEQLLHFLIQFRSLLHVSLLTIRPEQQGIDGFIVGIMGNEHPAVPGHLGLIPDSHRFLQFLEQGIHVQSFQTVPFRQIPVFVLCRILDEEPLEEGTLIQFQVPARIHLEFLHIHLDPDFRIHLDNGFPGRNEHIRSQDLLGFVNGIPEIFPGNGIGLVRPQHTAQFIPHHRALHQQVVYQCIDFIIGKEDFLPVFLDNRSA